MANVLPLNFILGQSDQELVSLAKPSFFDDGTGFYFRNEKALSKKYSYSRSVDTLLDFIPGCRQVKMIKIDVEGAELVVLSGATKVLESTEFLLVEVSGEGAKRFGSTVDALYDLVSRNNFGYAYTISRSGKGQPRLKQVNGATGNVLFSKQELFVN